MKRFIFVVLLVMMVGGLLYLRDTLHPIGVTENQAIVTIKNLPEVKEYLKQVPHGRVEIDNQLVGEYHIHVYEIKDNHTATFNWYSVNIKSGQVRSEF